MDPLIEVHKAHEVLDQAKVPSEGPVGPLTLAERVTVLWFAKKAAFKRGYKLGAKMGKKAVQK